jgi:glyoxylase-like metal-dependent hydrolase (beta-lactamase superfamily II)
MALDVATVSAVLTAVLAFHVSVAAQERGIDLRMYVLDCGTLKDRSPEQYNLTPDQVESVDMSDPCFLIVHPRGTLLWETGLNDAQYNTPGGYGPRHDIVEKSLKSQLATIGYTPEKITYLAISHFHGDHAGNANDYAASTWIVQEQEREAMFREGSAATPGNNQAGYMALKNSRTILARGDHDVFGDGTVVLKATPGHTPGHQSLFVRLQRTGPVVLSGDLYHFPAERTLGKMPTGEAQRGQTAVSRRTLEQFVADMRAQLWIQHDMMSFRKLRLVPEYYD